MYKYQGEYKLIKQCEKTENGNCGNPRRKSEKLYRQCEDTI